MTEDTVVSIDSQSTTEDPLTALIRERAKQMLQAAVNAEAEEYLARFADQRDSRGHAAVVRNGYLPEREILTGIGPVPVKVPRVRDRTDAGAKFESSLVPAYVRRAASVDSALPWLYLHGISQRDVGPALRAMVGPEAANLSSPVISRLKRTWQSEYEQMGAGRPVQGRLGVSMGRWHLLKHPQPGPPALCAGGHWGQRARREALPGH